MTTVLHPDPDRPATGARLLLDTLVACGVDTVFGYPGGVAWAIMVARICQLYPFANGATIVSKFFSLMQKWSWPRPVLLKHIEEGAMGLRVWNPQVRLSKARRRRRAC